MIYKDKSFMCISLKELPQDERPREKMQKLGPAFMSNLELMCILLGSGTKKAPVQEVAQKVLDYICSKNHEALSLSELSELEGIGSAKALSILSSLELGKRLCIPQKQAFKSPKDIWEKIKHYAESQQEHFICIMLNGAFEIIQKTVITVGLVNRTLVHPREVFSPAIEKRAAAIVIAHNHPSGNLTPSPDDFSVTDKLKKAGDLLGISVLDHLIFSCESFYSMAESGDFYFD